MKQDAAAAATASAAAAAVDEGSAVAGAKVASSLVLKLMEDQFECSVCREWLCAAHSVVSHCPACLLSWLRTPVPVSFAAFSPLPLRNVLSTVTCFRGCASHDTISVSVH